MGLSRERARQRLLIDLVAHERAEVPGALVLDHPGATAFSLSGLRRRVVLSSGAIEALTDEELAAVLAHERAHLHARHDLVLLPFRSLTSVLPRCKTLAAVSAKIALLVELAADDRARRECEPHALARALCTLATADPSSLGNVATSNGMRRRVERALMAPRRARLAACGSVCSALTLLALPFAALFAPLGWR